MLGDAFGRWRLRQARMSQELGRGTERRGRDRQSSPNSASASTIALITAASAGVVPPRRRNGRQPIGRRRYFAERGSQKWQRIGPRHRVVHEARRQQLPALSASRSATPSQREGRRGVGRVGRPPYPSPRMLSRRAQRHHVGLGLMFAHQLSGSLRHRVGSGQQHRVGRMQISRSGRVPLLKPAASSAVSHCPGSAFPRNRCAGRTT
jgi:hypothetical protein